jgi:hypothetical protein
VSSAEDVFKKAAFAGSLVESRTGSSTSSGLRIRRKKRREGVRLDIVDIRSSALQ